MTNRHAPSLDGPCLFGEVLFDHFPDGSRVLGGAPFNVAWHLQALGASPIFISSTGDDDSGRELRRIMKQRGMSTVGLQMDPERATGEVIVSLEDGEPSYNIVTGSAFDFIDANALPSVSPSLIYHGSLALRSPVSALALNKLLEHTTAPVFVDINLRDPWWQPDQCIELLRRAKWAKLNEHEVAALATEAGDLESRARKLQNRCGLSLLVVTLGDKGAFALDGGGKLVSIAPTPGLRVVDTVGAGDAFSAILMLGIISDWPLPLTLQRAQTFASRLVEQRGATIQNDGFYRAIRTDWNIN